MKHTILFVAANPGDTEQLALDQECKAIERELRIAVSGDDFDLRSKWAVSVDDLMRHLNELQPAILHFSGHGTRSGTGAAGERGGPRRDVAAPASGGIILQDGNGSQHVSERALAAMITSASPATRLVVLNACYSASVAEAIRHKVGCVVGMDGAINDDAARSFAVAFYRALGHRRSVATAVDQAVATLDAKQQLDVLPVCRTRDGVLADQIFLPTWDDPRHDPPALGVSQPRAVEPHIASQPRPPSRPHTAVPPLLTATAAASRSRDDESTTSREVDIAILTIRDDEFRAVLQVFPDKAGIHKGAHREYAVRHADAGNGEHYRVAVSRMTAQGNGEAQDAARDLLEDLAPRLVLVVGIAGSVPSDDVKLGDVVISTRIHDFTVEARKSGAKPSYALSGGPIDKALASVVTNLAAREDELGNWTDDLPPQPVVTWDSEQQLYGPLDWQRTLRDKLAYHHPTGVAPRGPLYAAGPIASSDRLVKDPRLLIPWLETARDFLAIEMESAGVYRAMRERCPMLAIRGISDIVGLKRSDAWTKYACASAAAFTRAFLRTRPIEVVLSDPVPPQDRPDEVRSPDVGQGDLRRPVDTRGANAPGAATPPSSRATDASPVSSAPPGSERYDLFLAHPSAYKASAIALYDLLYPDVRVFLAERSLQPGDRWDREIPEAQRTSRATVILVSSKSDTAWYLGDEIITAIALHRANPGHELIPVLLESGIALPSSLQHMEAIDLSCAGGLEDVAGQLRKRVDRLRGQPRPPATPSIGAVASRRVPDRSDHHRLYERLCQLSDAIFEQIVVQVAIERGAIAPRAATLAERALDVAQLAALDQTLCRRISAELDRRASWTRR